MTFLLTIAWACKENITSEETAVVDVVNLGAYSIIKHVRNLEHEYQVLSSQDDGGYLLNAPDGEMIRVDANGELHPHISPPMLLGEFGSAQSLADDDRVYKANNVVWVIKDEQLRRYVATDNKDEHKMKNELGDGEFAGIDLFWLSPKRIVGFGEYKTKSCTTQASCVKNGVRIFELSGDDKIVNKNVPVVKFNTLDASKIVGGFRVLSDGGKCFWLWNTNGELIYLQEDLQSEPGKRKWKRWKYLLNFTNNHSDIVEFDFDISTASDSGGLIPPEYIAVIAKGKDGKLALYTALPD